MGIDFSKINEAQAKEIINALKDGKIDDADAKKLGLTEQEQEALNQAFSSGQVEIGDFIYVNKGKVTKEDGKTYQLGEIQEKPGAWETYTQQWKDFGNNTVQNFKDAWNNSNGFWGTVGALFGATTKGVDGLIRTNASATHDAIYRATGSEIVADVAKYVNGGLGADALEAIDTGSDWTADKIRELANGMDNPEDKELLLAFADIVKDINGVDIALLFAGGAGAASKVPALAKLAPQSLSRIGQLLSKAPAAGAAVAAGVAMTSCSDDDKEPGRIYGDTSLTITVVVNTYVDTNWDKIIEAIKELQAGNQEGMEEIAEELRNLVAEYIEMNSKVDDLNEALNEALAKIDSINEVLEYILEQLVASNNYLFQISQDLQRQGKKLEEIILILNDIKTTMESMNTLIGNINVSNSDIKKELQAIYDQMYQGGLTLQEMNNQIKALKELLTEILNNQEYQITLQKDSNMTLDQIKALLANIDATDMSQLETLIDILNAIKEVGDKVDTLIGQVNTAIDLISKQYENDQEIKNDLDVILQLVQNNQVDASKTNELLNQIIEMLNKFGSSEITKEDIAAIIDAISKNGDKIDATNQLLAKIQAQDENFQKQVLAILADLGVQSSEALTAILEAIVNDSAKLDAIAQLLAKIQATVEKYGEEGKDLGNQILEAINKLGIDISGKLTQILEVANNSTNDGKAIMALLDKVLAKLDTMDANQQASAKAIIEAIANIKIGDGGSGNVDLSSLEKMLSELLELTSKNNGLLEDINGKMDVINLTIERAKNEILAHMNQSDATTEAILNALNEFKNISTSNDKEILSKMDTIINILNNIKDSTYDDTALMSKLDEILAAIKDHNITVDITGKVTCECNCGGNHEGILGDLEDVLG